MLDGFGCVAELDFPPKSGMLTIHLYSKGICIFLYSLSHILLFDHSPLPLPGIYFFLSEHCFTHFGVSWQQGCIPARSQTIRLLSSPSAAPPSNTLLLIREAWQSGLLPAWTVRPVWGQGLFHWWIPTTQNGYRRSPTIKWVNELNKILTNIWVRGCAHRLDREYKGQLCLRWSFPRSVCTAPQALKAFKSI